MFKIKNTILIPAVLAFTLGLTEAGAQTLDITAQTLSGGSTVYLISTPNTWQNDDWGLENNIARDSAGNIYVAGTFNPTGTDAEMYVKKISSSGAVVWTSSSASAGNDYGRGAALDGAGNVYALGLMDRDGTPQVTVIKYNLAGAMAWVSSYPSGSGSAVYDIAADSVSAYVAGSINSKIAILKFAAAGGVFTSSAAYNGGSNSAAYSLALSGTQIVVAGAVNDYANIYGNEIWLGKFNKSALSYVWASTYIPPANHVPYGFDEAHAVKTDASGNIYVAGFLQNQDSGQDIWFGKFDPSGNLIYAKTKNGPSNGYDKGFGLALDSFGNIYVTGKVEAYSLNQGDNLWLGKYSPAGALLSEVTANRTSEVGYDVEAGTGMVVVGGGFENNYGLLNVYPQQFGAPQQLFAGPGYYTGAVNLSWTFDNTGTYDYKIQYSTFNGGFLLANAQVSEAGLAVSAGYLHNYLVMGLPAIVTGGGSGGAGGGAAGPVYYFKVWTSADGGSTWAALTNVAYSAAYAPFNYIMESTRGQDSFKVFNNSYGSSSVVLRDASNNTYAAYGSNMGGLGITKFDQYGAQAWTSFNNYGQENAEFTVSRLAADGSGNLYAAGAILISGSSTGADAWVAKFNASGAKLWERVLPGAGADDDELNGMVLDASNNVYVAGGIVAGGASEMLLAKFSPAGVLQSSFTYKPAAASGAYALGLAADASNLYVSGFFNNGGAQPDWDAAVVKYTQSMVYAGEQQYLNTPAGPVYSGDMLSAIIYSGGALYATGAWYDHAGAQNSNLLVTKLDTATLAQVWFSTYNSADNDMAIGYDLRMSSGSLYVSGFENRFSSGRNMLLRKLSAANGQAEWTKSIDGVYSGDNSMATGLSVGSDGYFYLAGLFSVDVGGSGFGQAGIARVSEPVTGITAMPGPKPCSVQLSWASDTELPAGTTFYVHYATYTGAAFNSAAAQYSFVTDVFNFNGSFIDHIVPGLEAGNGALLPGQSNIDSPMYYFKMGYKKPGFSVVEIGGSTNAAANTPGTWDRTDRYPNGNMYVMNNVHGERFPLVRDAAGNIYTAGSFSAWGWNSNTAYVRKFNSSGQAQWTRYYSDEYDNSAPVINALALDTSGNLYAAGTAGSDSYQTYPPYQPESATKRDALLIKYSASNGRMQWAHTYVMAEGNSANDDFYSLAVAPAGLYAAGRFMDYGSGTYDAMLVKLGFDGVVISSVVYSSGNEWFNSVSYDAANDHVLAAGSSSSGNDSNAVLKVYDASLAPVPGLDITVDKGTEDEFYSVIADTVNPAVYLAGAVASGGTQDAYIARFSTMGVLAWEQVYNSASQNDDEAYGIALDGAGGVYLSGTEYRYDLNQGKNIFFRKYNTDGDLIWSQALNSAGNNEDTAGGIAADAAGNVFTAVDAAQMGAAAGGYNVPGTYNTGNTANTANTINGAGFFKHTQFSMITVNPRLTVRVNRQSNQGLQGVSVAVMSFKQSGGMDPNGINLGVTDSSGAVTMALPSNRGYFVAISSHNMVPTISEQISDPNGNFFVELNADTTRQYYLSYRQPAAGTVRRMTIHLDGLQANEYVMGEVFINSTGEKVAYSIIKATGTKTTMDIYNLGPAANGIYGMAVNIPARNKAMQLFMNGDFPAVNYYEADMNNAMIMATGFDVDDSTTPPTITGLVNDANFSPLKDARVRLDMYSCSGTGPNSCTAVYNKESLTDVSGRYNFYNVPYSTMSYNLNVGRAGYESGGRGVLLPAQVPGTAPMPQFEDFQLALATYTFTGVLKYNGMPMPNAVIMVNPDGETYSNGADDSYRFCQWGGCGIRADARVRTGADGSFTVPGMTDGNARMDAVFEDGWRPLNEGNSYQTTSDNLRVTISSQGASGPSLPANNPCRPGRVWVLNSQGSCVAAGRAVFNIVPEDANTAGQLYGDLTFITTYTVTAQQPLLISTSSPITLMARETGGGGNNTQMGFTSLAGRFTSNTTSYAIVLSTGASYSPRVYSSEWAKSTSFKIEVELTDAAPSVRQNISVVRAGGLRGKVKFPDGSNFKPQCSNNDCAYSASILVKGVNVDFSEDKRIDDNGEFEFPNVAPGKYNISLLPAGSAFAWAPASLDGVTVTEGRTTEVKIQLEKGLAVRPQIYGLPAVSTAAWGYFIIGVESGEEMTQKTVTELFFSEPKYSFDYSTSTGWSTKYMPAGQYDFYLMMGSKFDPCSGGDCNPSYTQFANFIGRVKGLAVQKDSSNPNIGTAAQPIPINILGAIGQARIAGTVDGNRIFTPTDMARMFDNFSELFPLIPAVMLYDTAGDLRGFANAMPTEADFPAFWTAFMTRDVQGMTDYMAANPMEYGIWGVPPGRYTAVFANPNYPPVSKEITLPGNAAYSFDFDQQEAVVAAISGVVKSSATGEALGGARVYLKHRIVEKFTLTDSSGAFSFSNLPAGIYRLEATRNGYVTAGYKTGLSGADSAYFAVHLLPSESVLTGRLFMSKFPAPVTKAGVQVVAYDETLNVEAPSSYLPKTEVQTDASGNYEITGVIPGHLYKLSAFYQGKLPEVLEVTAQEGNTVVSDITLKDTPPQITIKVKRSGDSVNKVDVIIKSPKQLISIPSCQYNPGSAFDEASAVTLALVPGPNKTYLGQFTVTTGQQYYTVKVTAGDGSNKMEKEFIYDQVSNAKTEQYIQQESLAGGEIQMDKETEEYSGIELDPGALSYSTATTGTVDYSNLVGGFFSALPSVRTVKTDKGNLSVSDAIQSLMASEIYNMSLSNASANKPFTLTLKYDKERGSDSRGLRIYQYDEETGSWIEIPGDYTVDPMTGVVSVDVGGLTNAYEGTGSVTTPLGRKHFKMSAVVNGRYVPSAAGTSQTGRFAVFTANPPTGMPAFSSAFEVYNMPNPFSLKSKSVSLSGDIGSSGISNPYPTTGTVIKYNLPAGKSGNLKFVIYNLAGEKVRTIDEGVRAANQIYYSEWDGRNDTNQDCASGVYFMLTYVNGKKLGAKAHKMAIIK